MVVRPPHAPAAPRGGAQVSDSEKRDVIEHLRKEAAKRSSGRPVWAIYFCGKYHHGTFTSKREAMSAKAERIDHEASWHGVDRGFLRAALQVDRVMVMAVPSGVES